MKKIFALFLLFTVPALFAGKLQYVYTGDGTAIRFYQNKESQEYFFLEIFRLHVEQILQGSKEKDIIMKKTRNPVFFKAISETSFPHSKNKGIFSLSGLKVRWTRFLYVFPLGKNTQLSEKDNLMREISCEIVKQDDIFYLPSISFKEIHRNKNDIGKNRKLCLQYPIQEGCSVFVDWNSHVAQLH